MSAPMGQGRPDSARCHLCNGMKKVHHNALICPTCDGPILQLQVKHP